MKLALILFVCLIAAAQAALPNAFKNKGALRETLGAWTGPSAGGGDDNKSVYTTMKGGWHEVNIGKTLSYECAGRGRYRALIEYTTIAQDGKMSKSTVCETGHVDLASGIYRWEDSETECPKLATLKYVVVRSSPWKAATSYSCK